jgi:hypothetical protein
MLFINMSSLASHLDLPEGTLRLSSLITANYVIGASHFVVPDPFENLAVVVGLLLDKPKAGTWTKPTMVPSLNNRDYRVVVAKVRTEDRGKL